MLQNVTHVLLLEYTSLCTGKGYIPVPQPSYQTLLAQKSSPDPSADLVLPLSPQDPCTHYVTAQLLHRPPHSSVLCSAILEINCFC